MLSVSKTLFMLLNVKGSARMDPSSLQDNFAISHVVALACALKHLASWSENVHPWGQSILLTNRFATSSLSRQALH